MAGSWYRQKTQAGHLAAVRKTRAVADARVDNRQAARATRRRLGLERGQQEDGEEEGGQVAHLDGF